MNEASARPAPDELLAHARREDERIGRGKLTIFFGAAPGVGKTFAMLSAGNRLAAEGHDVVVGLVETHGRAETERQVLGLDILPRRSVEYRGVALEEFDLDAALSRHPEILLLDELAHSNAPGSRFAKRHEDVNELLDAGISVFTTLNVQHLESLNHVIERITEIPVRETVPDSVFDDADVVELVDLPPEALLERLRAGKVYLPDGARRAANSFFRIGNLAALRELALRRTAESVDRQMERYQKGKGIRAVWPAADRVLVCVSPSPSSATLVRAGKRLATGLRAELLVAYVETDGSSRQPHADRERVLQTLRLAESLGAQTVTLAAPRDSRGAAAALVQFARARNVSRIVIGKTRRSRWREILAPGFMEDVIRLSGEIDVQVIEGTRDADPPAHRAIEPSLAPAPRFRPAAVAGALLIVGVATGLAALAFRPPDLSAEAMIFVGGVVIAAWRCGRRGAFTATVASILAFNYFFTEPRFTFAVNDFSYLITFAVMLAIGLFVGELAARIRGQVDDARERERSTAALYGMTRQLASARDRSEVATVGARHVQETFGVDAAVLMPKDAARTTLVEIAAAGDIAWLDERERGTARWALDHGRSAGHGTSSLPSAVARHVPLSGSQGLLGVLSVRPRTESLLSAPAQIHLLETFARQVGFALERVELIDSREAAQLEAETERLRGALLSTVSHDLRTPLAAIAGAASALDDAAAALSEETRRDLVRSIVDESRRLNELIGNLVFATQLESGIRLRKEWATVDDLVGSGLAAHRAALADRALRIAIPRDLPFVLVDSPLMTQVFRNLAENAIRHTPTGTPIRIDAWATDASVIVRVADEGPGFGAGNERRIFDRFFRGERVMHDADAAPATTAENANAGSGLGLGLSICRGVVEAHGGRIWAERNEPRGTAFFVALPFERPQPTMPAEAGELEDA